MSDGKADAVKLAERVEVERVPPLRWEPREDGVRGSWGFSGAAIVAGVMPAPGGWLWDSVADLGCEWDGMADTPDAAEAAAEAAFRASAPGWSRERGSCRSTKRGPNRTPPVRAPLRAGALSRTRRRLGAGRGRGNGHD